MNRFLTILALASGLALSATTANAQGKVEPNVLTRADGSFKASGPLASPATSLPLFWRSGGNAITLTQNASQDIVAGTGVACPTPPTSMFRLFELGNFPLGASGIDVRSIDIGIEAVGAAASTTVNLYRLTGEFVAANLTLVATAPLAISPADDLSIRNVLLTGTFARTDRLVVEWAVPQAGIFFGGNEVAQSGLTYLRATGCATPEPTDLALLAGGAFATSYWVANVNGLSDPIAGPSLQVAPSSVNFGRVPAGTTTPAQTVTLTNNGTAGVTISSITGSGAPFAVSTAGVDLTLTPGQSTTISATFAPTLSGPATGTITIASNAPGSPVTVALSGEGFAPPPNDNATSATPITSGVAAAGTNVEATQDNPGDVASCVGSAINSVWWTYTPSSSGTVTVTTDGSSFDTVLTLQQPGGTEIGCDDDGGAGLQSLLTNIPVTAGTPVLVRVAGFGGSSGDISLLLTATLSGPGITVAPDPIAFGVAVVGTPVTRTATITNTGNASVSLTSATVTGSPAVTVSGFTAGPLAVGAARTLTLTYAPTTAGTLAATLSVVSSAPDSPDVVALTGSAATTAPGSYPSTDTPITIPDNNPAGIVSTITVPAGAPGVGDLNVDLDVTHTWVGDLTMTLAHAGVAQAVFDRPGVPAGQFGCSGNDVNLVLDDEGTAGSIDANCTTGANPTPAYTANGSYRPDAPLTVFDGLTSAGAWTLTIADGATGDTGTLNAWALIIARIVAEDGGASVASSRMVVAPNPLAGQGQIDLTVGTTQDVRVALFDALGREVRVLLDRSLAAGQQAYVGFTTAGLPAGVYVVRAVGTDVNLTQRVTVVR